MLNNSEESSSTKLEVHWNVPAELVLALGASGVLFLLGFGVYAYRVLNPRSHSRQADTFELGVIVSGNSVQNSEIVCDTERLEVDGSSERGAIRSVI